MDNRSMSNGHSASTQSANSGASFANGNGPGGLIWPAEADWQAGVQDDRLLSHWAAM